MGKNLELPSMAKKLQNEFHLTTDRVELIFTLTHNLALETYVKALAFNTKF